MTYLFASDRGEGSYRYPERNVYQHGCDVVNIHTDAQPRSDGIPEKHEEQ